MLEQTFLKTDIFFLSDQTAFPLPGKNPGNISGGHEFRSLLLLHPKSCMSRNPKIPQIKTFAKAYFRKSGAMIFYDFSGISRHCFT